MPPEIRYARHVSLSLTATTLILLPETGIIDPQGVYRFPIIANHFYGIGTPLVPINLGTIGTKNEIRARVMTEIALVFVE